MPPKNKQNGAKPQVEASNAPTPAAQPAVSTEDALKKQKTRPAPTADNAKEQQQKQQPQQKQKQQPKAQNTNTKTTPDSTTPSTSATANNTNANKKQKNQAATKPEDQQLVQLTDGAPSTQKQGKQQNNKQQNKQATPAAAATTAPTGTTPPAPKEKKEKTAPVILLPTVIPHHEPIPGHIHEKPIAGLSELNAAEQALKTRAEKNPKFDEHFNDPSLEYYEKPMSIPLVKEAAQYFSELPVTSYAFDWTKDTACPSQPSEGDDENNQNPQLQVDLYNYNKHFAQCQKCQSTTTLSVTKNLKDHNRQTVKGLTTIDLEPKKYPFRVIMDNKDMWRTHGKFAVRPCSDHNKHLEMNRAAAKEQREVVDENGDAKKPAKKDTKKDDTDTYGQKTHTKNAFLYNNIRYCNCGKCHIGLFKEGTRCITPNSSYQSPSHHPLMNYALKLLTLAVEKAGVQAYSDIDGTGFLRYIVVNIPNTIENSLYQQWYTHTNGGTKNEYKSDKKYLSKFSAINTGNPSTLNYPKVQLSLVWSEGIGDDIKKQQKLVDIEPLLHLPFPLALDDLKRQIFTEPKAAKKGPKPTAAAKEDLPTNANKNKQVVIKADEVSGIKYAKERQESFKQLYALLKVLLTDFKLAQRQFIDYLQALGYTLQQETFWTKEMAYYYQINQIKTTAWNEDSSYVKLFQQQPHLKELLLNADNTLQYDKFFNKLESNTLAKPQKPSPAAKKATAPVVAKKDDNKMVDDVVALENQQTEQQKEDNKEEQQQNDKEGTESTTPELLPYKSPVCADCNQSPSTTKEDKEEFLKIFQTIVGQNHGTNPNWLKMPAVDALNSTTAGIWGSIFCHYNNAWSHSNNVYSLGKNAWHHIFGSHCIDETVMATVAESPEAKQHAGIPLVAIDYPASYNAAPQHTLSLKNDDKATKKNKTIKFDDNDADDVAKTTATTTYNNTDNDKKNKNTKDDKKNNQQIVSYNTTTVATPKFSFSPSVFRQGNLSAFSHLLQHLITLLPAKSKHIVELHSGCGTISLHTLHHTSLLTVSDVNAHNKTTFQHALQTLPSTYPNVENNILYDKKVLPYLPLSSDLLMQENITFADCIIVDPPRKGLDATTLEYLKLPYVDSKKLYPNKTGGTEVGAKQEKPAVFPFDIDPELYINRTAKTTENTEDKAADNTMSDETKTTTTTTTAAADKNTEKTTASNLNKNKRDKKKWTLGYSKIAEKHQQQGTMLFTNTKEHFAEQIGKAKATKDGKEEEKTTTGPPDLSELKTTHWAQTANTLVYVSCGFTAFKNDCDALINSPAKWKIAHTHAHLLFPGSNHIETLTVFVRGLEDK